MYRTIAGVLIAMLVAVPATATSWVTDSFRTATGDLVQRGDTMTEVLQSAGEPAEQRVISKGISIGGLTGLTREQWTYRTSDGTYVVTFAGSTVERIDVIPKR